jgi:hypothetical protein
MIFFILLSFPLFLQDLLRGKRRRVAAAHLRAMKQRKIFEREIPNQTRNRHNFKERSERLKNRKQSLPFL